MFLALTSASGTAQIGEQCDGQEYNGQRMCENGAKCVAQNISYSQVSFSVEKSLFRTTQ
jgi:hypothetical protein